MDHKRGSFSGKIGFVLSAAGASVGLGNIWRFPYLAAKYGGAIFLLVYIILAMTFGYTMIIAETSIGRMTGKSPVGAYKSFSDKPALRVGGWINAIIPILIVPYYSVIGGWVIKYLAEYLMGKAHLVAVDGLFLVLHLQRRVLGALLPRLHGHDAGDHLCGRGKRHRARLQDHDAHSRGTVADHRRVFRDPPRCAGGRQVLPCAQS